MTRTGRRARVGRLVAAVGAGAIALGPLAWAAAADMAAAQDTTTTVSAPTTTTVAPTTTTVPPTTSTTVPPTTSTTGPTTTTTRPRPTTTTSSTTTTTAATTSSSSRTWGWVLLAVVLALAVLLVALLLSRLRRQGREADWDRTVGPSVAAAELARDLVASQTPQDDEERRASVALRVDEAVDSLEAAAATAPDPAHGELCTRCAQSLRGFAFAVEADRLLRSGTQAPTGEQLAAADAARRNRSAEFERVLYELKAVLTPRR